MSQNISLSLSPIFFCICHSGYRSDSDVGGKDGAGATEQVRPETTLEEHHPLSLATQIFQENFHLTQRSLLGFF